MAGYNSCCPDTAGGPRNVSCGRRDRSAEDNGRRHQVVEWEVKCCHSPWEDRCGLRLRLSFAGSHLETALASPVRDRTFPHVRPHTRTHTTASLQGQLLRDAVVEFQARQMLNMNTQIFPSIVELLVPALTKKTDTAPATGLSQTFFYRWLMLNHFPSPLSCRVIRDQDMGGRERGRV